jgi:carbamate kinase
VIDKDRASALLAARLAAERLVILTEVPAVYRRFRKSNQAEIRRLTADEAESLLPEFAAGSMRPKIEAAVDFARTGGVTLITSFDALAEALEGRAGTLVSKT